MDAQGQTLNMGKGMSERLKSALGGFLKEVQDLSLLSLRSFTGLFRRPYYFREIVEQMDILGAGSLVIVLLTNLFSGMALALQFSAELVTFGAKLYLGKAVTVTIVRELGPVLTALMVAGRVSSGIASELGSMQVGQQIDALRVMGADPVKKLVTPRLVSMIVMLPLLTVLGNAMGVWGGYIVAFFVSRQSTATYWSAVSQGLNLQNLAGGLVKPFVFAFIIALVGCHSGFQTTGGTRGVGRSTTRAVVTASILILVANFLLTKLMISLYGWKT